MSKAFNEPVSKRNVKSVLERKGSINLSFGDRGTINNNIIGYIDFSSDRTKDSPQKNHSEAPRFSSSLINLETAIKKLHQRGLSDDEIADVLDVELDDVENLKW